MSRDVTPFPVNGDCIITRTISTEKESPSIQPDKIRKKFIQTQYALFRCFRMFYYYVVVFLLLKTSSPCNVYPRPKNGSSN